MSTITIDTKLVGGMMREWTPQLRLDFPRSRKLSYDDFFEMCRDNSDARIEMDKDGNIEIMASTGTETGVRNFELIGEFWTWAKKDATGQGFDSSTGFKLPNGAKRSPDLSWMTFEKWNAIPSAKRKKFAPVCPDFVVELRSETDALKKLQAKMEEYTENGASLGWLLDAVKRRVYVYRPNVEVEIIENPATISGEPLLKGFTLNIREIWK